MNRVSLNRHHLFKRRSVAKQCLHLSDPVSVHKVLHKSSQLKRFALTVFCRVVDETFLWIETMPFCENCSGCSLLKLSRLPRPTSNSNNLRTNLLPLYTSTPYMSLRLCLSTCHLKPACSPPEKDPGSCRQSKSYGFWGLYWEWLISKVKSCGC